MPDRFVLDFEVCALQVFDFCGLLRTCMHKPCQVEEEDIDDDIQHFVVSSDDDISVVQDAKYVDCRVEFNGKRGRVLAYDAQTNMYSVEYSNTTQKWTPAEIKARLWKEKRTKPPRIAVLMDLEREKAGDSKATKKRTRLWQESDSEVESKSPQDIDSTATISDSDDEDMRA